MTTGLHFPKSSDEFAHYVDEVKASLNITLRLPDWPFLAATGYVTACEFDQLLGSTFVPVVEALSEQFGDEAVTMVVVDPSPEYYQREYSFFSSFRVDRNALQQGYWAGLSHEPNQNPTGAIAYTANTVALVGSSHKWAVWGQRDWEVALLLTPVKEGQWLDAGVSFVDTRRALAELRSPTGWGSALPVADIATLLDHIAQHGTGDD